MNNKFDYMSMEELSRLMRNEGEDKLLREAAARQLCKRENQLLHSRSIYNVARVITPTTYGF